MLILGLLFLVLAVGAFLPPSSEATIGGLTAMNLPFGENTSTRGNISCATSCSGMYSGFQVVVSESDEVDADGASECVGSLRGGV